MTTISPAAVSGKVNITHNESLKMRERLVVDGAWLHTCWGRHAFVPSTFLSAYCFIDFWMVMVTNRRLFYVLKFT